MGTSDDLLVDRCMLEEVREHQRTAAAAYYYYQKAHITVPHEWQIEVMQWLQFHPNIINFNEAFAKHVKNTTDSEEWQ